MMTILIKQINHKILNKLPKNKNLKFNFKLNLIQKFINWTHQNKFHQIKYFLHKLKMKILDKQIMIKFLNLVKNRHLKSLKILRMRKKHLMIYKVYLLTLRPHPRLNFRKIPMNEWELFQKNKKEIIKN